MVRCGPYATVGPRGPAKNFRRPDHYLRAGHGLFEALASDSVDAVLGRGGDDLVAALAQNGDRLRADQAAGAADDDDLHGLPPWWTTAATGFIGGGASFIFP